MKLKQSLKLIEKALRLNKRYQNTDVFKNLCELCVCVLTHNALQYLLFILLFFLPNFWKNWQWFSRVCSVLFVEVRESKIRLVSLNTLENSHLFILLIFVQNACDQLKHKQILEHARKMPVSI